MEISRSVHERRIAVHNELNASYRGPKTIWTIQGPDYFQGSTSAQFVGFTNWQSLTTDDIAQGGSFRDVMLPYDYSIPEVDRDESIEIWNADVQQSLIGYKFEEIQAGQYLLTLDAEWVMLGADSAYWDFSREWSIELEPSTYVRLLRDWIFRRVAWSQNRQITNVVATCALQVFKQYAPSIKFAFKCSSANPGTTRCLMGVRADFSASTVLYQSIANERVSDDEFYGLDLLFIESRCVIPVEEDFVVV